MDDIEPAADWSQLEIRGSRVAIAGLVLLRAYLVGFVALRQTPRVAWTDARIAQFYQSFDERFLKIIGLYVVPFAGIAFFLRVLAVP